MNVRWIIIRVWGVGVMLSVLCAVYKLNSTECHFQCLTESKSYLHMLWGHLDLQPVNFSKSKSTTQPNQPNVHWLHTTVNSESFSGNHSSLSGNTSKWIPAPGILLQSIGTNGSFFDILIHVLWYISLPGCGATVEFFLVRNPTSAIFFQRSVYPELRSSLNDPIWWPECFVLHPCWSGRCGINGTERDGTNVGSDGPDASTVYIRLEIHLKDIQNRYSSA